MLGELTSAEIEELLQSVVIGRIGCHAGGRTYVVPITFAYDGRRVIGHSGAGQKVAMMRENPEVCFEIEKIDDLANWKSVIAWGRYRALTGDEAAAAMGFLVEQLRPHIVSSTFHGHSMTSVTPPNRAHPEQPTTVFAIDLTEKTGRFEWQAI
jgi:nitroimidazol reductase NimA-like FMN-containing flavoprotein (pyridoxamine 5'-phosphate oxidase superfamily)